MTSDALSVAIIRVRVAPGDICFTMVMPERLLCTRTVDCVPGWNTVRFATLIMLCSTPYVADFEASFSAGDDTLLEFDVILFGGDVALRSSRDLKSLPFLSISAARSSSE